MNRFQEKAVYDLVVSMADLDKPLAELSARLTATADLRGTTVAQTSALASTYLVGVLAHAPRDESGFDLSYVRSSLKEWSHLSAMTLPNLIEGQEDAKS